MSDELFLNGVLQDAGPRVADLLQCQRPMGITPHHLDVETKVSDHSVNALLLSSREPVAFIQCSSSHTPDAVATAVANANQARELLDGDLKRSIPVPYLQGKVESRTYAVWPLFQDLPHNKVAWRLFRPRLSPHILGWLRQLLEASLACPTLSEKEVVDAYRLRLQHVNEEAVYPNASRQAADSALARLEQGKWLPKCALMHGDLWKDNLMLRKGQISSFLNPEFVVIDWPGAQRNGYPFYDLVRIADSMQMKRSNVYREIVFHSRALNCEPEDAVGYLTAAHGHYGLYRGEFPLGGLCGVMDHGLKLLQRYVNP
jgi:hypothetical protein